MNRSFIEFSLIVFFCILGISLVFIFHPKLLGTISILGVMVMCQLIVLYNRELFGESREKPVHLCKEKEKKEK